MLSVLTRQEIDQLDGLLAKLAHRDDDWDAPY
jgi:hypothetical protein